MPSAVTVAVRSSAFLAGSYYCTFLFIFYAVMKTPFIIQALLRTNVDLPECNAFTPSPLKG